MELKIVLGTNIGEFTSIKNNELMLKTVLVKVYFVVEQHPEQNKN